MIQFVPLPARRPPRAPQMARDESNASAYRRESEGVMEMLDLALTGLVGALAIWGASWRRAAKRDGISGVFAPVAGNGGSPYSTGTDASGRVRIGMEADGRRITLVMTPDQARAFAAQVETTAATTEMGR